MLIVPDRRRPDFFYDGALWPPSPADSIYMDHNNISYLDRILGGVPLPPSYQRET